MAAPSDEKDMLNIDSKNSLDVQLQPSEDPQQMSEWRKVIIVLVICSCGLCATTASSIAAFTETHVAAEWNVSHIITVLSVSLFVLGLALGPLLIGPLSEVYGRNPVYVISFGLFFAFSFGVAWAPEIGSYLVFRFITGFCSSAFLSVAGGTLSDIYDNRSVAVPMALYSLSPFIGPAFGPFLSGFINQNLYWRWTWRIQLIWIGVQWAAIILFVPETYTPVLVYRKKHKLQKENPEKSYICQYDDFFASLSLSARIWMSVRVPVELVIRERMALLLNCWTALLLAVLYLTFQMFPIMFQSPRPLDKDGNLHYEWVSPSNSAHDNVGGIIYGHAFTQQETGLTFLGIAIGQVLAAPTQIWWIARIRRIEKPTPEDQLKMGEVGGILAASGLFIMAFTSYPSVHWIAPIIGSIPFGWGIYYVFGSVFTYLVIGYRPIAASAMASNTAMRCLLSTVLPLATTSMYDRMGTVGATAFLAGMAAIMAPFPFIFSRIGGRLRRQGKFADPM